MAAHPRSLGHCFNPISVFWCFDDAGAQAAVVVEVHNTYGDRHAYLVHPDEQGRARTDKAMYVSPFHGVDGWYDIAVPVPTDRLHVAVTLRGHDADGGEDSAPFSASLTGTRSDVPIRAHARRGPAREPPHPRPRHLAVGPAPARPSPSDTPPGRCPMTLDHSPATGTSADLTAASTADAPAPRPTPPLARAAAHGTAHRGLRRGRPQALPRRRTPPRGAPSSRSPPG